MSSLRSSSQRRLSAFLRAMRSDDSDDEEPTSSEESEEEEASQDKPTVEVHFLYNGQSHKEVPNDVTHMTVASGVKRIERAAFHSCEQLVSVQLSEGLEEIGAAAFGTCSSLTEIAVPNSTIDIPKTVTSIGPHAFYECETLQSVDLPIGLTKICHTAFGGCASLKEIDVPSTVKHVGTYAFRDCKSLAMLKLPEGLKEISEGLCENCSSLRALGLPSTVTKIGQDAFRECSNLVSLEIPETLEDVGEGAFFDCQVSVLIFPPATKKQRQSFRSNIQNGTKDKFGLEELPIHRVCYYQSFHSLSANLKQLDQAIKKGQKSMEDEYGNTPFHVLAASFAPNFYMFQKMLQKYPTHLLNQTNCWTQSPMDYLYRSKAPESAQLLEQVMTATILQRSQFLGLEEWRVDISRLVKNILASSEEERVRDAPSSTEEPCGSRVLGQLRRTLLQLERLEVIALLESALWKHKIQDSQGLDLTHRHVRKKRKVCTPFALPFCLGRPVESEEKCCFGIKLFASKPDPLVTTDTDTVSSIGFEATIDENDERIACLVNSGAGIVIPNVLPYLGQVSDTL